MPPTRVRMPDGKVISFPDGTPPDEMQTALAGYGKPQPTTEHNSVEEGNDWSLADAVQRGVGGFVDRAKGALDTFRPRSAYEMIPGVGQLATVNRIREGLAQNTINNINSTKKSWDEGDYIGAVFKAGSSNPSNPELYDQARKGDIAGAMGRGAFDAGTFLAPELAEKGGNVATDVLASDAAKNFVEAPNLRRAVAGKVVDWARNKQAARSAAPPEPGMLSLGDTPGVKVAPGAPVAQPRIPSPAEDLISAIDNESAVRVAPNKGGRPPKRVPSPAESIQSPLEQGQGNVAPRQFGDAPVSADASRIPTLADEMVGPLEEGHNEANLALDRKFDIAGQKWDRTLAHQGIDPSDALDSGKGLPLETLDPNNAVSGQEFVHKGALGPERTRSHSPVVVQYGDGPFRVDDGNHRVANALVNQRPIDAHVAHFPKVGWDEVTEDNAILERMREDLDAHGRNALHEESTDFAARNKVGKSKTGKPGYGFNRKLPEAGQ